MHIEPSPEARRIYSMMVVRANNDDGLLHLPLANSIALSVELTRMGEDGQASCAVAELRDADWIAPLSGGGWSLA